jgi:hypothetical protein
MIISGYDTTTYLITAAVSFIVSLLISWYRYDKKHPL